MDHELFRTRFDLLYLLPPETHRAEQLRNLLTDHPEVWFISLVGVDLAGNDTDEKIPIRRFIKDVDGYLNGGVQTDGSSVVLPGIATLEDGKVDLVADAGVNWFIDYNFEHMDARTGRPVGTLRIPSFLKHNGQYVCSRSILKRAVSVLEEQIRALLEEHPHIADEFGFRPEDLAGIGLSAASELEFWVRTPDDPYSREKLSTSQGLQEQYWKRTKGAVRTALESAMDLLGSYGFHPEMGHKEVGGVKAGLSGDGKLTQVMEQIEIDWRFSSALQAADNELFGRIFIKEIFRLHGLEASFLAKPVPGVAGSGEHTHVNIDAHLKDGRIVNLFSPADFGKDYLSRIGWGALMGFMKHYDAISPFITVTNDAFNRLKPGFEAPTHAVASLGAGLDSPSRNRTVLLGLIRDAAAPMATRFEVRSPNPHTNSYLGLAAMVPFFLDGIRHVVSENRTGKDLETEFDKNAGAPGQYLPDERAFRSERDVFEAYDEETRNRLFGTPPATVFETLRRLQRNKDRRDILLRDGIFTDPLLRSFSQAMLSQWERELQERILPDRLAFIRSCVRIDSPYEWDEENWDIIEALRNQLAKDRTGIAGVFSQIRKAFSENDLEQASELQKQMDAMIAELESRYRAYERNNLNP